MLVGLLVGAMVLQGPVAPVSDTVVRLAPGRLEIRASSAANQLTVKQQDQTLYVTDVVPVAPGPGCESVTAMKVSCSTNGVYSVSFFLGDGDDMAHLDILMPANGSGGHGNDGLWGGNADDVMSGGYGNDSIFGNGGADTLYGDAAVSEPACLVDKAKCADKLYGQSGDDYLNGGERSDNLSGGTGDDTLDEPTSGANWLDGGTDDDTIVGAGNAMRDMVIYDTRVTDVWVNLSNTPYDKGSAPLPAHTAGELALGEHDTITGVHDISTGAGDDLLIGAGGNPALNPGPGIDRCDPDGDDDVPPAPC